MPYKRRVPCVSISPHVKYPSVNAKKFGMSITDSAEKCGFGSSTERFHQSAYYLEHGEPGGNRLFSPQVGKSVSIQPSALIG